MVDARSYRSTHPCWGLFLLYTCRGCGINRLTWDGQRVPLVRHIVDEACVGTPPLGMRIRCRMAGLALGIALSIAGVPSVSLSQEPSVFRPHRVATGDTWWGISRLYRVPLPDLLAVNGASGGTVLRAGASIRVPGVSGGSQEVRSDRAPVAGRVVTTDDTAAAALTESALAAEQSFLTHVVRSGESEWSIGRRYGLSVAALRDANNRGGAAVLRPGDVLRIPASGAPPAIAGASAPAGSISRPGSHRVVKGDSWWGLSRRYGTSIAALKASNPRLAKSGLHPGSIVALPGGAPRSPLAPGRYIVLDPGHGGPVARGTRGSSWPAGLYEADVTWAISEKVKALVEAAGISVRSTRQSVSEGPSLASRAAMCGSKCELFVSIHINAMPRDPHPSRGLEAYIPTKRSLQGKSKSLAQRLTGGVQRVTGQPVLRIKPRGLAVLRRATRPSVLLELGFATHPTEGPWLLEQATQDSMATAVAHAIIAQVGGTPALLPLAGAQ